MVTMWQPVMWMCRHPRSNFVKHQVSQKCCGFLVISPSPVHVLHNYKSANCPSDWLSNLPAVGRNRSCNRAHSSKVSVSIQGGIKVQTWQLFITWNHSYQVFFWYDLVGFNLVKGQGNGWKVCSKRLESNPLGTSRYQRFPSHELTIHTNFPAYNLVKLPLHVKFCHPEIGFYPAWRPEGAHQCIPARNR